MIVDIEYGIDFDDGGNSDGDVLGFLARGGDNELPFDSDEVNVIMG